MSDIKQTKVAKQTYERWVCMLDPNKSWLKADIIDNSVVRVWCAVCAKYENRIRGIRNFSDSFIRGVTGSAIKKDNITKHIKTDCHIRAEKLSNGTLSLSTTELLTKTLIGKMNEIILLITLQFCNNSLNAVVCTM